MCHDRGIRALTHCTLKGVRVEFTHGAYIVVNEALNGFKSYVGSAVTVRNCLLVIDVNSRTPS